MIPWEALNQHIAVLGKTGSGKTYAAKGIVEGLLRHDRQVCVLDPTAAWWGLRLGPDGKKKGFDVVLLGGARADVPLDERSGSAVARLVTQQGASVVIDTSGMTVGEYTRWFIDFAGTLYTTIRNPLHLVIDEAHYFMPESGGGRGDVDRGKMLHAGNRLMSGGRSKGVRGMMITQRPAKLHKDSLTCADTLIAMRVIAPQDRLAIKAWIDGAGDPAQGKQVIESLAGLERGEGWVWYPEASYLKRAKFPKIKTYDSSATPEHGVKSTIAVGSIDLAEVEKALAEAVAEAKANDPKLLRRRIAELEKEAGRAGGVDEDVHRQEIEAHRQRKVIASQLAGEVVALGDQARKIADRCTYLIDEIYRPAVDALSNGQAKHDIPRAGAGASTRRVPSREAAPARSPRGGRGEVNFSGRSELAQPVRKILDAIAFWEALGVDGPARAQVAFVAGYKPGGGHFTNTLGSMRTQGLIDYPRMNVIVATEAGRSMAEPPQHAATAAAYYERLLSVLSAPQAKIVRALLDGVEPELSRDEIAEACGFTAGGGHFTNTLGSLRTLGLIDYPRPGQVCLTDVVQGLW